MGMRSSLAWAQEVESQPGFRLARRRKPETVRGPDHSPGRSQEDDEKQRSSQEPGSPPGETPAKDEPWGRQDGARDQDRGRERKEQEGGELHAEAGGERQGRDERAARRHLAAEPPESVHQEKC